MKLQYTSRVQQALSILTAEGLFPALPLPPVQVQRGQGQEEVLGGPEGHLVLRRAHNDGLKNVVVGSQITRKENVSKNAVGIYFCWLPCLTKGSMQQWEWLFVSTLQYIHVLSYGASSYETKAWKTRWKIDMSGRWGDQWKDRKKLIV